MLSKQSLNKRTVHIKRFRSVIMCRSLNIVFQTLYFQHVVLVGGFAASDWLFSRVYEFLTPLGLNIVRPENHVWVFSNIKTTLLFFKNFRNKAVSDGAISFYLDHLVRTRVSKFTYCSLCDILYNPYDPDHKSRSHQMFLVTIGSVDFSISYPKWGC